MEKIKFVKEIGYVILVTILMIAFIYRLGLSNVGKLELVIYIVFFNLALVHLLKRNKKNNLRFNQRSKSMPIYLLFVTLSLNVLVLNQLYLFYKKKEDLNSTVAFLVCLLVIILPNAEDFNAILGLITGAFVIVYLGSFVYSRLASRRKAVK
ncbi:hypothetical protein NOL04_09945 [Streptococcus suis]|nr:hypothetical protein [Streptococcus suis]